ncbi:MAG: cytochrome c [Acidimicrobiales bacterium]|nr:cytochrome c [Acidimicrobiales bacterium]
MAEKGARPLDYLKHLPMMAVVAAALGVGLGACGSGNANTTAEEPGLGAVGAEVYAEACASCHGADLSGTDKGPSFLSIVYEPNHHTDDSFRNAIANGSPQHHWNFGDMEPVDGLTDDEVEAVIAFVRTEQERQGFEQ